MSEAPSLLSETTGQPPELDDLRVDDIRSEYVHFYTRHGIKTDDELHNFIKVVLNYHVPRVAVCKKNCCAPFDFIADNFFQRTRNSLAFANRTGGKTLDFAILNFLDAWFKGCEIAEVGAIKAQAYKCYKYTSDFFKLLILARELVKNIQSETTLSNGGSIQVLAGTFSGVNSPHPQKANADEIELMDWDILQEFFSMAKSRGEIIGQNRLASTRKFQYGTMQNLLEKIALGEINFRIYRWCIWEALKRCTAPAGACKTCKLYSIEGSHGEELGCQGWKAKKSDGFYHIEDFIDKVVTLDIETLEAQWFNLRPGAEGLVYKTFDPEIHVVPEIKYSDKWPVFSCYDFGYTNPFVCLWFQIDYDDNVLVIKEYYEAGKTVTEHKKVLNAFAKQEVWPQRVKTSWGDDSGAQEIAELGSSPDPIPIQALTGTNILDRLALVRQYLKIRDNGQPRIYFSKKGCPETIKEHMRLHYPKTNTLGVISELPVKSNDHTTDALQYGLWGWHYRFRGSGVADVKSMSRTSRQSLGLDS